MLRTPFYSLVGLACLIFCQSIALGGPVEFSVLAKVPSGQRGEVDLTIDGSTIQFWYNSTGTSEWAVMDGVRFRSRTLEDGVDYTATVATENVTDYRIVANKRDRGRLRGESLVIFNNKRGNVISKSDLNGNSSFTVRDESPLSFLRFGQIDTSGLKVRRSIRFGTGVDAFGDSSGMFVYLFGALQDRAWGSGSAGLNFYEGAGTMGVWENSSRMQVKCPTGFVDVSISATQHTISFYEGHSFPFSNGFYNFSAVTPMVSYVIDSTQMNDEVVVPSNGRYEDLPSGITPPANLKWDSAEHVVITQSIGSNIRKIEFRTDRYSLYDIFHSPDTTVSKNYKDVVVQLWPWRKSTAPKGNLNRSHFSSYEHEVLIYVNGGVPTPVQQGVEDIQIVTDIYDSAGVSGSVVHREMLSFPDGDVYLESEPKISRGDSSSGPMLSRGYNTTHYLNEWRYHSTNWIGGYSHEQIYMKTDGLPGINAVDNFDGAPALAAGQIKTRVRPFKGIAQYSHRDEFSYHPNPVDGAVRVASITTTSDGVTIGKKEFIYDDTETFNNQPVLLTTTKEFTDASSSLQTISKRYSSGVSDEALRSRPISVQSPDGKKISYLWQKGTWDGDSWVASSIGTYIRSVEINGKIGSGVTTFDGATIDPLDLESVSVSGGIAGRSTANEAIRDPHGMIVFEASYVYANSNFEQVSHLHYDYDRFGNLEKKYDKIAGGAENRVYYEASYTDNVKNWEQDEQGIRVTYTYDDYGRVETAVKEGITAQAGIAVQVDISTHYSYYADGQVASTTVGSGTDAIETSFEYYLSGQIKSRTEPGGLTTSFSYPLLGTTQITLPNGGTRIEDLHPDRLVDSITGSAVPNVDFSYEHNSSGQLETTETLTATGKWKKTTADWLGRVLTVEEPTFDGGTRTAIYSYNVIGQLTKQELKTGATHLMPPTLFEYDDYGRLEKRWSDSKLNGSLDTDEDTNILWNYSRLEKLNSGKWMAYNENRTYPFEGASENSWIAVGKSYTQLSGFTKSSSGYIVGYGKSYDAYGNLTETESTLYPSEKRLEVAVNLPDSDTDASETNVNGLVTKTTNMQGHVTSLTYDSLGRLKTIIDPRLGVTHPTTNFYDNGTMRVNRVALPDGGSIDYGYNSTTGELDWQMVKGDAGLDDAYTRFDYDVFGNVTHVWGNGTNPVKNVYNSIGQRTEMHTYRSGNWTGASLPSIFAADGDKTTWGYQGLTGLQTSKTDADSKTTVFTYDDADRLLTLTDARSVVTSYSYYGDSTENTTGGEFTGALKKINYPDAAVGAVPITADISYSYHRNGSIKSVTDGLGTRNFVYSETASKPFQLVREELGSYYGSRLITYDYNVSDVQGIAGLQSGFQVGTSSDLDAVLKHGWSMSSNGRIENFKATPYSGGTQRSFTYGYETNSNLLKSLTVTNPNAAVSPFSVTRSYESNSHRISSITSLWSSTSLAQFDYGYDIWGRRDWTRMGGDSFEIDNQPRTYDHSYNSKSELTSSLAYLGTDTSSAASKLPNLQFEYGYDEIGNRTSANFSGDSSKTETFTPNNLNQIVSRQNKVLVASGTAASDLTVALSVDGEAAFLADKTGGYWSEQINLDNATGPAMAEIKVFAGANGQVQVETLTLEIAAALQTHSYDDNGNLTSDGVWNYVWDAGNRLVSASTTNIARVAGFRSLSVTYEYDYLGRNVERRVVEDGVGQIQSRRYLYQDWNIVAEFDAPNGTSIGNLERTYAWGLDLLGTFDLAGGVGALLQISDHRGSGQGDYLPAHDANGNIVALYDADTGDAKATYEYSPFGELLRAEGDYALENPFRFSSKFTDDATGLVNYGLRFYDPRNGRFINRDPIADAGGLNLYGFVGNNPTNQFDFLGLEPKGGWADFWDTSPRPYEGADENSGISVIGVVSESTGRASVYAVDGNANIIGKVNVRGADDGDEKPFFTESDLLVFASSGFDFDWWSDLNLETYTLEPFEVVGDRSKEVAEAVDWAKSVRHRHIYYREAHRTLNSREGAIRSQWFGAAALVTQYNAVGGPEFWGILGRGVVNKEAGEFLTEGNEFLFPHNVSNFISLRDGKGIAGMEGLSGRDLDYALVGFEQNLVQDFIDGYDWSGTNRTDVFREVNGAFDSFFAPNIIDSVIESNFPNGGFDFSKLEHRITLGRGIVDSFYEN